MSLSHDDADGQRDLQALVAIGDQYEQEAAPPDTDGSLRDLHQRAAQDLSAADDDASEQESRKPSVLVVDDSEAICQMIAVKLQLEGFNVVGVAADGRKAVGLVGRFTPFSLSCMAILTSRLISASFGNSASDVMRPNCPIASCFPRPSIDSLISGCQNPKAQCCLNADMLQNMPRYMKWGKLHFIVSSTSGQEAWIILRMRFKIGWAKSADFPM